MLAMDRRKSIIHVLNVFLTAPITIHPSRETSKYIIGYQPKVYREHNLLIKISKELINAPQSPIAINKAIDINVREDYRLKIRTTDESFNSKMKNITMRIIPTRYNNLEPIYATLFDFKWRHTSKGGIDDIEFNIPECPTISNYNTIPDVCYKKISSQVSGSGTHALQTYIILSKNKGIYQIGKHIRVSNETFHEYIYPISVSL
jgi:hypothetical protein